jgi:hypothetical protein
VFFEEVRNFWSHGATFRFKQALVSRAALRFFQRPIKWVSVSRFLGVRRLRSKANHSPPGSAKSTDAWSYT